MCRYYIYNFTYGLCYYNNVEKIVSKEGFKYVIQENIDMLKLLENCRKMPLEKQRIFCHQHLRALHWNGCFFIFQYVYFESTFVSVQDFRFTAININESRFR